MIYIKSSRQPPPGSPSSPEGRRRPLVGALALFAFTVAALPWTATRAQQPQHLPTTTLQAGMHNIVAMVARTPEQRATGLMYRREMPAHEGMLFVFEEPATQCFWMKNTLIPLDMLFIDDGGRVVGLIERAEPLTTSPRDPGVPCRYVLEVNGGLCHSLDVCVGDRVRLEFDSDAPGLPQDR